MARKHSHVIQHFCGFPDGGIGEYPIHLPASARQPILDSEWEPSNAPNTPIDPRGYRDTWRDDWRKRPAITKRGRKHGC